MIYRILLFIAALLCLNATVAQEGLDLDDIASLKSVLEAKVSPDGKHVAYVQRVPRDPFKDPDGEAWSELLVLTGDRGPRRFIRGDISISSVTWSLDSAGIYFLAKRDGDEFNALRAIPVDGGESFEVCALEKRDVGAFALAPDGGRFAVLATPPEPEDREKAVEQGFRANVYEESKRNTQIYMGQFNEDEACDPQPLPLEGSVKGVSFAPSGDRLLVRLAPTPHIDDEYMHTRLKVVSLEGTIETSIENLGKLGPSRWSPDGKTIAFIGVEDHNDPAEGRLKVADAATGVIRNLTPDLPGHVQEFGWTGDRKLLALIHFGVTSELQEFDLDSGATTTRAARGGPVLREVSASAEGRRVIALGDSPSHPREVFEIKAEGPVRLTDSNPWLEDRRLARQEPVHWKSRDGIDMEGVLIYPLDYQEGQRYPMIAFVHGGPESHRSNGWLTTYSQPIQVAAAKGYVSFVPNYRGSTGRGVAFTKLHQHNYAYGEFDDIVDGKEHLVDIGLVDRDRVGITGGSYGGYATAWSATALTQHYAAGVMFVGISNQISKFGTTDIPNEMFQVHSRAWPWDDWQWMLERSPIYHVEKSRTPLLIMHGDADPRVHPAQSLEMYRFLKQAGQAPVRLVYYPDEKHGNRKAAAQYDYSIRLMRWMDHYLKGEGGEPPDYEIDYSDRLEGEADDAVQ